METEMEEKAAETTETAAKGTKSIINPKYKDKYKQPDWLGTVINSHCTASHEVKTVVKGKDGAPDTETTKTVNDGIDYGKLSALARENGIDPTPYDNMNAGQKRMNIGNKLRSLTLKRHGLVVDGEWVSADTGWLQEKGAPASPTHNRDGSVIPVAKAAVAPKAEATNAAQDAPKAETPATPKKNGKKGK